MDDDVDYDRRAKRSGSGSAAAALMIVLVLGMLMLFAILSATGNDNGGTAPPQAASLTTVPQAITAVDGSAAEETIAFQALLSQAQTEQQAARQEAVNLQTQLQASQAELQQTQERLRQAEARAAELQTQAAGLRQQIEQERWWLPIGFGVIVLLLLAALLLSFFGRQNNKQQGAERERSIQLEMTRMRVMYHDALEKAQQQLDLMRHQLAQVRGAATRQLPRDRSATGK